MNFTNRILHSLFFVKETGARKLRWIVVCALLAASAASLVQFNPRQAQAEQVTELRGEAAVRRLQTDGGYASLAAALAAARYQINAAPARSGQPGAQFYANNPGQQLRATFASDEVRVHAMPNKTDGEPVGAELRLKLAGFGYGERLEPLNAGTLTVHDNRITIHKSAIHNPQSAITEWYVNKPEGLEQGFTLDAPPSQSRQGEWLRVALAVGDGWRASVGGDQQAAVFERQADGLRLGYDHLVAYDARGRALPARMSLEGGARTLLPDGGTLSLLVDDTQAVYPLTIDPILTQQQKLTSADGAADDQFGISVALSGDTAVVGASGDDIGANVDQGSAYVFTRSDGVWTQQQKLTAQDGAASDFFGVSVSLSGDTVVVGAHGDVIGANVDQGSAYVFTRNGRVWTQQQKLTAQDGVTFDLFGISVALSGDTVVVGAQGDDIGPNVIQGSAYVFTRSDGVWTQQQKIVADDGASLEFFGARVAISGDTLVVGTFADEIDTNSNQGSAYIFTRSGGVWTQQQKLTADDGAADDSFGASVAISGETVVVGAPGDDTGENAGQGSAYVFTRNGVVWTERQKLTADDGTANDSFGVSVAISGDTVVVGAPSGNNGLNLNPGSAYVFAQNGTVWTQQQKLKTNDGAAVDFFGSAVTLSGDTVLVGAPFIDIDLNRGQGAAYVFVSSTCPAITVDPASLPAGEAGQQYNQTLTATGGAAPFDFTISAGALPNGMWLSSAGSLSGVPTVFGEFDITVQATDANGCTGSRAYSLVINPVCSAITVNPASLHTGLVGVSFNQTFTATGGDSPHTFTVGAGTLPAGLNLSPDGALSGTTTTNGAFNFTVTATDANGCQGKRSYTLTIDGGGGGVMGLQYFPLPHPIRLLDTRPSATGCFTPGAPLQSGETKIQPTHGTCDGITIPTNAAALVGNATVVNSISSGGFITLWPAGAIQPTTSNLNYTSDQVIPNAFTVGLGTNGEFNIFASGSTHLIIDIAGYYAPPDSGGLYYHPLPHPIRLLDTRAGALGCTSPGTPLQGGAPLSLNSRVSCNGVTIPDNAQAIVGNATVVNSISNGGFITLWPTGANQPTVSNLNYTSNQIIPNAFTVGLGPGGSFEIFASTSTDFIVDVTGYYSSDAAADVNGVVGLLYNPLPGPIRLLDTRPGETACTSPGTPLQAGVVRTQNARLTCEAMTIPSTAQAVVGNGTVVNSLSEVGFITLWPNGTAQPTASNLNYISNQVMANSFTVGLGTNGEFNIFASSATHFIVDLTGYFAP